MCRTPSSISCKSAPVRNSAEYDGRFFAKIYADNLFEVLFEQVDINNTFNYIGTSERLVYSMMSSSAPYSATHIGQQDPDAAGAPLEDLQPTLETTYMLIPTKEDMGWV